MKPYETSSQRSNTIQKRGMTIPQSQQPLPQIIAVPEVQERTTVRHIHQLTRQVAASAPRDESTSVLRKHNKEDDKCTALSDVKHSYR
jgi:hypothetical protein